VDNKKYFSLKNAYEQVIIESKKKIKVKTMNMLSVHLVLVEKMKKNIKDVKKRLKKNYRFVKS
jgi:hypothetical protein